MSPRTKLLSFGACLAFVLAVTAACGGSTPAGPTQSAADTSASGAVITGSVTGDQTAGITVRVIGTDLSASVGSTGAFEIAEVPAGNARLQFTSGAVNATADVANVTPDEYVALQVQVSGTSAVIVSISRSRKVSLCHAEGNGDYHLINVSESAEAAHRAHGDAKIGEPVPGQPDKVFNRDCRPVGPSVRIKKFTNGEDADTAPGPEIPLGAPVQWRYVVTNDGAVNLTNVSVVDDRDVTVNCATQNTLAVGATMTCSGSGIVRELGPYRNIGRVTADWSRGDRSGTVTDRDPSHYLGVSPVRIKKFTNGEDADTAPGPSILVGTRVTWTYRVTNIGTVPLTNLEVLDDQDEDIVCPSQSTLAPGASITCTAMALARLGPYRNLGMARATWTLGPITAIVTVRDPSHYLGVLSLDDEPKVTLCHKTGNGSYHSITVGISAEPAHRAHGDGKIGEPVPGLPGKVFGPGCSVQ